MARVVFVHGIWQGRITREKLADEVWADLPTSLDTPRESVDAPTYGSCYRSPGRMGTVDRDVLEDDDVLPPDLTDVDDFDELDREILAAFLPPAVWRGTELGVDLHRLGVGALARSDVSYPLQALAVRALCQVRRYLLEPAVRRCVKRRVAHAIGPDTELVLAHSLGSVVAYEVLRDSSDSVPLLVTLGSPLGLPSVLKRVRADAGTGRASRPNVGRWVNFAAADDPVSIRRALADSFDGVEDHHLPAGTLTDVPHRRSRYLTTAPVATMIEDALR